MNRHWLRVTSLDCHRSEEANAKIYRLLDGKIQLVYFKGVNRLLLMVMPSKDILAGERVLALSVVICKICSCLEVCSFD